MSNKEILEKVRLMSNQDRRNISYEELVKIISGFSSEEIVELSNIIGYPVFTRLCMGVLNHRFVLLQDGAACVIVMLRSLARLIERCISVNSSLR